jgi:hypothetical protein
MLKAAHKPDFGFIMLASHGKNAGFESDQGDR